jgi:F-type H+-transporting ATPase subunit epsilon
MMALKITTPVAIVVDERASRITANGLGGAFGLLPRHIDFVAPLVPGILVFADAKDRESFVGHDEATLVKQGDTVLVATRRAVCGDDLRKLEWTVREVFLRRDEGERMARTALARLEAGVVRGFMELERDR